jgi:sirohydrochlorin ferrochelatase
VAEQIRRQRPALDVRPAFCEQTSPNLRDVLARSPDAVVTPLLLASAYHARVDIPEMIAVSGADARQADVLGEDERLLRVMHQRLAETGVSQDDPEIGVLVVAVGSSWDAVNVRTASVARALAAESRWAGAATAFATGPRPSVETAAQRLRRRGATRLVIAPWFLAHGRITDRVANFARANGIAMAEPLGAHPLVAQTVLDRFDQALAARVAA